MRPVEMQMAGYSQTPLLGKLGFKPGQRALFSGVPETLPEISAYPDFAVCDVDAVRAAVYDLILIFETEREQLEGWARCLPTLLDADGMVWIAWPKKASRRPTTISEGIVREVLLPLGLVDVKVCAIDEVWSGLKMMVRRELREQWPALAGTG